MRLHLLDQLRKKLFAMSYSLDQAPLPSRRAGPAAEGLRGGGKAMGASRMASSRPWGRRRRGDQGKSGPFGLTRGRGLTPAPGFLFFAGAGGLGVAPPNPRGRRA